MVGPLYHFRQVCERSKQVVGGLGPNFGEVVNGLAAGLDDGGDDAGFLRLADVVVGVADIDGAIRGDAELLHQGDDAQGTGVA